MIKNLKISDWFKRKNKKNIEYFRNLVEQGHGYSMLKDSIHPCNEGETNYEIALQEDNLGYMPEEVGRVLDQIVNDSDYVLGVHCTRNPDEGFVDTIFKDGLINNGHASSGVGETIEGYTDISRTVTIYDSKGNELRNAISNIKKGRYGPGDRIIFKIPKSYLGKGEGDVKPIFYNDGSSFKVLPEFILGSLTVDENQKVSDFNYNPNYKDNHDDLETRFTIKMEPKYLANGQIGRYKPALDKYLNPNLDNSHLYCDSSLDYINKFGTLVYVYNKTVQEKGEDQALYALRKYINENNDSYFVNREYLRGINSSNIIAFMANQLGIEYIYDVSLKKMDIETAKQIRDKNDMEIINAFVSYAANNIENTYQSKSI